MLLGRRGLQQMVGHVLSYAWLGDTVLLGLCPCAGRLLDICYRAALQRFQCSMSDFLVLCCSEQVPAAEVFAASGTPLQAVDVTLNLAAGQQVCARIHSFALVKFGCDASLQPGDVAGILELCLPDALQQDVDTGYC